MPRPVWRARVTAIVVVALRAAIVVDGHGEPGSITVPHDEGPGVPHGDIVAAPWDPPAPMTPARSPSCADGRPIET